jgi:hypothetical protein
MVSHGVGAVHAYHGGNPRRGRCAPQCDRRPADKSDERQHDEATSTAVDMVDKNSAAETAVAQRTLVKIAVGRNRY